jgi:hypothetical protein
MIRSTLLKQREPVCPWRTNVLALALVAIGMAGCGGGVAAPAAAPPPGAPPPSGGDPGTGGGGTPGTATILVKVTDYFGEPVSGATVTWMGQWPNVERISDDEGVARFDGIQSGTSRLCAHHRVRGHACGPQDPVTVPAGSTVELIRQLKPCCSPPTAAVLETSIDPGGLSSDGRTLDITIRVGVTRPPRSGSWFDAPLYPTVVVDCVARDGLELAEMGPRCIRGPDGSDSSYTFDRLIEFPTPRTLAQPAWPATVGLLFDQSAPMDDFEQQSFESRLYAAKIFADQVLPETGLLLAGFASDDPAGNQVSPLYQKPVMFLPAENPGLFFSRPEAYEQLDGLMGLSGGIAPLYEAILSSIDFVADHAVVGARRVLVVMAGGRDDACGTPAQCAALRAAVAARARQGDVELWLVGPYYTPFDPYIGPPGTVTSMGTLAVDAAAPLIGYGSDLHEALDLVRQLLGESIHVEDIRVRLSSDEAGAFHSGVVVAGELRGSNPSNCPWYCFPYAFPFSVRVP